MVLLKLAYVEIVMHLCTAGGLRKVQLNGIARGLFEDHKVACNLRRQGYARNDRQRRGVVHPSVNQYAIANLNLMFMAVFIRGLTGSPTNLLHHVVRGLPIAVHAGDEIVSGFQLVIRGVTKVEDVGFTTRVKAVVEIVRGVG